MCHPITSTATASTSSASVISAGAFCSMRRTLHQHPTEQKHGGTTFPPPPPARGRPPPPPPGPPQRPPGGGVRPFTKPRRGLPRRPAGVRGSVPRRFCLQRGGTAPPTVGRRAPGEHLPQEAESPGNEEPQRRETRHPASCCGKTTYRNISR